MRILKMGLFKKTVIAASVVLLMLASYLWIDPTIFKFSALPQMYFVSFGNENFVKSRVRIARQASKMHVFDKVIVYDEAFVATLPPRIIDFVANNKRGYGYWIWKSFAVERTLSMMRDGDFLVYADSGCTFRTKGRKRLKEYFAMIGPDTKYDMISFSLPAEYSEKKYTKMDAAVYFSATAPAYMDSSQYMATYFVIRKTPNSMKLVREWVAASENFHLIDDSPSITPNDPAFIDHRHDQSLWSLLRKRTETTLVLDVVFHPVKGDIETNRLDSPILGTRRRE